MSTTNTYSGALSLTLQGTESYSDETTGSRQAKTTVSIAFAAAGGTAPTISDFFKGSGSVSGATDLLLAHATDPLQGAGAATLSAAWAPSGAAKLKAIYIKNTAASGDLLVERGAANGLPIFDQAGEGLTLAPGDFLLLYRKAGTATITTGSNDKLTVTPSAGTVTFDIEAIFGP